MTFSSKSDDLELPRVGEVWCQTLPGNQPRLWLMVRLEAEAWMHILCLETGLVQRYNALRMVKDNPFWERFASPDA